MLNDFRAALMRRTFICSAIIAILASFMPGTVRAQGPMLPLCCHMRVTVQNDSTTCVWVSVAVGPKHGSFHWITGAANTARFIKPGAHYVFNGDYAKPVIDWFYGAAKVEGTFMKNPDCSGGHARSAITDDTQSVTLASHQSTVALGTATGTLSGRDVASYRVVVHNH
jgi:hypothetical protein